MGGRKPTLGYPSRSAAVIALQSEGLTTREIADRIGISHKNVISLSISAMGAKKRATRPTESFGRTIVFPIDILGRLAPYAAARGISTNELVRRLIEIAVDDGLIDSILDDGPEQEQKHG